VRSTCVRSLLVFAWLASASWASAQHGIVRGGVTYQDGSAQDFISVYLDSKTGDGLLEVFTETDGSFEFRRVPIGKYDLYAYEPGMQSSKIEGVTVISGGTERFDLRLSPVDGPPPEIQTVYGRLTVDPTKTSMDTTFSGDFIRDMPAATSSIEGIVAMAPKVSRASSESDEISASGGGADQIAYSVDGNASNNPVGGGGTAVDVSTFMIEEFQFLTGGWQAKYGERSTGIALVTTRSGATRTGWRRECRASASCRTSGTAR
jgi:hypothetical protein